jgi:hypothetical protein
MEVAGEKAVTTKNYMDVEDRGQNLEVGGRKSEVRGQKREILLWERLSAAILRFRRFERV